MADHVSRSADLFTGLLLITVELGIEGIAFLVYDGIHGLLQGFQRCIVQHGIQVLQLLAHGQISLCSSLVSLQHFFGSHEAAHVHLGFLVLGDFLTGGQHFLVTGFHFSQSLFVMGIDVRLLCSSFDEACSHQLFIVLGYQCLQLLGSLHAGCEFHIGILGAGFFFSLSHSLTDGSHAGLFSLGLLLGFLLGDIDIAFHNTLAGCIQQGLGPHVVDDGQTSVLFFLGQVDAANCKQNHKGHAKGSSNASS